MAEDLGTATGRVEIDVSGALHSLALLRSESASSVGALNTIGRSVTDAGFGIASIGVAIAGGFAMAVEKTAELDKRLSYIGGITNITDAQMEKLRQTTIKLGQDSAYTAIQVADGFTELAKAGATTDQIIGGMGEAMITLGQSSDIALDKAAAAIVSISSTFGLAADQASHIADVLQGAANSSIISVEDMSVSFKYAGGVAASLGISLEDTATALALLGNAGIKGSTAGTSLRRIFLQLTPRTEAAATAMKQLGIITADGSNKFYDATGKAKSMAEITEILRLATEKLTPELKQKALATIFGDRAINSAIALSKGGAAAFNEMYKAIGDVSAADVAAARLDNLAGAIEIFKGSIDSALIAVGTPAQEPLKELVQWLTKLVNAFTNLSPEMQKFIVWAVLAVGAVSLLVGGFLIVVGGILRAIAVVKSLRLGFIVLKSTLMDLTGAASFMGSIFKLVFGRWFFIIGLIGLFVTALVTAWNTSEEFRTKVKKLWDVLSGIFAPILDKLTSGLGFFQEKLQAVAGWLANGFAKAAIVAVDSILALIAGIQGQNYGQGGIVGFFQTVGGAIRTIYDNVSSWATTIVEGIGKIIEGINNPNANSTGNPFLDFFINAGIKIKQFIDNIPGWIENIKLGIGGFISALSGEGVTSDGFVGFMERIGVTIRDWGGNIAGWFETAKANFQTAFQSFKEGLSGVDISNKPDEQKGPLDDFFNQIGLKIEWFITNAPIWFANAKKTLQDGMKEFQSGFNFGDVDEGKGNPFDTRFANLGVQIAQIWAFISPILDNIKKGFSDFWSWITGGEGSQTLQAIWDNIVAGFNLIKPGLDEFVTVWTKQIWPAIQEAGRVIIAELVPAFNRLWPVIVDELLPALKDLWNAFAPIFGGVLLGLILGLLGAFKFFASTLAPIITFVAGLISGLIETISIILSGVIQFFAGVVEAAAGFTNIFMGIVGMLLGWDGSYDKMVEGFKQLLGGIWDAIAGLWKAGIDGVLSMVGNFIQGVINFFTGLWEVLVGHSIVPDIINGIISWFGQLFNIDISGWINTIIGWFGNLVKPITDTFSSITTSISNFFGGLNLGQWINDVIASIGNAVSNIWNAGWNIGVSLYNGLVSGAQRVGQVISDAIQSALNNLGALAQSAWNAAWTLGNNIWEAFKSGMGIHSPSFVEKAMMQLTETTEEELKTFASQVRALQTLGRSLPGVDGSAYNSTLLASSLPAAIGQSGALQAIASALTNTNTAIQQRPLNVYVDTVEDGDSLFRRARADDNMLSIAEGGNSKQLQGLGVGA